MNLVNDTFHDIEILGIYRSFKNLNLLLEDKTIILENIKYWEFTAFAEQNIIFNVNYFNVNNVPSYLIEEYQWISNYKSLNTLNIIEIDSSVGLNGVAIFSNLKIVPHLMSCPTVQTGSLTKK